MSKGKGGGSQPKAPDPGEVSAAQTGANINTATANAWLNNPNVVNPWGSTTYAQTGTQTVGGKKIPTFTQTNTLSPEQQKLYEQGLLGDTQLNELGLQQIGRIGDAVSSPFSLDQFGPQPVVDEAYRAKMQQALQDRLNPQLDRSMAQLEQRLANQGIAMGSEAWRTAMDQEARNRNDANLAVIAQSGNEEAQQYGLASQSYQQRLANALLQRQQPLQEFAQFTGASNNFIQPGQVGVASAPIQPTDVAGPIYANYGAKQGAYQSGQNANNAMYGALAGLGGSALGGWATNWG